MSAEVSTADRDAAVRRALDALDWLCDQAVRVQQGLSDGAWGPSQSVGAPEALAAGDAALEALAGLSGPSLARRGAGPGGMPPAGARRERLAVVLEPGPGARLDAVALRQLLKYAGRVCGLRCVEVRPAREDVR